MPNTSIFLPPGSDVIRETLVKSHARLLLHGHTHVPDLREVFGHPAHVCEVGSGTYQGSRTALHARYNIYDIGVGEPRTQSPQLLQVTARKWNSSTKEFHTKVVEPRLNRKFRVEGE